MNRTCAQPRHQWSKIRFCQTDWWTPGHLVSRASVHLMFQILPPWFSGYFTRPTYNDGYPLMKVKTNVWRQRQFIGEVKIIKPWYLLFTIITMTHHLQCCVVCSTECWCLRLMESSVEVSYQATHYLSYFFIQWSQQLTLNLQLPIVLSLLRWQLQLPRGMCNWASFQFDVLLLFFDFYYHKNTHHVSILYSYLPG